MRMEIWRKNLNNRNDKQGIMSSVDLKTDCQLYVQCN